MVTNIMGHSFRGNSKVISGLAGKVFGVGPATAARICAKLGIYPFMRMHQLNEPKILAITKELSELKIGSELKNTIRANIRLKRATGSYAGKRHESRMPVRGQNTHSNAQTAKRLNKVKRVFDVDG